MELPVSTPSGVAATYCVPWNPSDPMMSLYQQAANMFNTDDDPSLAAIIMVALQNQMMLYRKGACTDCATQGLPPTQTVINPPTNSGTQTPQGIVQTNTTDQAVDAAIAGGSQTAEIAGTAVGGPALGAAVSAVASVVQSIAGIFTQAHEQAVAEEQSLNCSVAFAFNKYIPLYDAAVANGSMSADTALSAVTQLIQQQLSPALDPVISGHNWGWGANQVLQAHLWFRQQWYPKLETAQASIVNGITSLLGGSTGSPSALLLVALAIVAALLL